VANRAKKDSQNKTCEDLESSNPALTPTANAEPVQPGTDPDPDRYRYNLTPRPHPQHPQVPTTIPPPDL
jgi:hypothetical protein